MTRCFPLHMPCFFSSAALSDMSPCTLSSAASSSTSLPITPPVFSPRSPLTGPSHFMSRRRASYASSLQCSTSSPLHSPALDTPSSSSSEFSCEGDYRSREPSSVVDFDALPSLVTHSGQLDQTVSSFVDRSRSRVPPLSKRTLEPRHSQSTYGLGISGVNVMGGAQAKEWAENEEHPWYPGIPIRQHSQWHAFAPMSPPPSTNVADPTTHSISCVPLSKEAQRLSGWRVDDVGSARKRDPNDVKLTGTALSRDHENDDGVDDDDDDDMDDEKVDPLRSSVSPRSTQPTTLLAPSKRILRIRGNTRSQASASQGLSTWWRCKTTSPHTDRSER